MSGRSASGRPASGRLRGTRSPAAAAAVALGELFDQLFDAGEQFLFGARVMSEA